MTKEFFKNKRMTMFWYVVVVMCFVCGIIFGAVYCMTIPDEKNVDMFSYLTSHISQFSEQTDNFMIFKNAVINNLEIFLVIAICAFFRIGFIPICVSIGIKGFSAGFTTAALVHCFGIKGCTLAFANIPSSLLLIPAIIFFGGFSIRMSFIDKRGERNLVVGFLIVCFIVLSIFCVSALIEGYINTIFMNLLVQKI